MVIYHCKRQAKHVSYEFCNNWGSNFNKSSSKMHCLSIYIQINLSLVIMDEFSNYILKKQTWKKISIFGT